MGLFREGGVGIPGSLEWIQGGPGRHLAGARREGLGGGLLAGFSRRLSRKLKSGWALEQA